MQEHKQLILVIYVLQVLLQNDTKRSEELKNKYRLPNKFKRDDKIDVDTNNTNTTDSEAQQEAINQQQKYFKKLETRCESKRSKYVP